MPLTTQTGLLSISDCKVRLLLTDPASGTATYGAWVDLPDVTSLGLEGDTDVKERRGDGVVRSRKSVLTGLTVTIENTALDVNLLAKIEGGTLVQSGTTPNQTWTYTYGGSATPAAVQISAKTDGTDLGADGDVKLDVFKATLTNKVAFGFSDDDFQTFSYEFGAVARNSDNAYYAITGRETGAELDAA